MVKLRLGVPRFGAQFGPQVLAAAVLGAVSSASFAQSSGSSGSSDPTSTIVSTLGTYATDVGLLAAAVLLIFYGKKLASYLRVT